MPVMESVPGAVEPWRKSSRSIGGNCVEVAAGDGVVHVRDSKDPQGPVLSFTNGEWHAFLAALGRRLPRA
jgi:hypothetical protein